MTQIIPADPCGFSTRLDMRLDAFIGPGTCLDGDRLPPLRMDQVQDEHKPIVVSGFEPLDMLQSIVMLLRQLQSGEAKVEKPVQAGCSLGRKSRSTAGNGRGLPATALL